MKKKVRKVIAKDPKAQMEAKMKQEEDARLEALRIEEMRRKVRMMSENEVEQWCQTWGGSVETLVEMWSEEEESKRKQDERRNEIKRKVAEEELKRKKKEE